MRLPLPAMLLSLLGLGVFLPWARGLGYLDPHLLFAVAQISLAFTGRMTVALSYSRSLLAAGLIAGLASHALAILVVANGLLVVNLLHWIGPLFLPPTYFLISLWGFGLAVNVFSGLLMAWLLSKGISPARALLASRAQFFLAIAAIVFLHRFVGPEVVGAIALSQLGVVAAGVLLILNAILARLLSPRASSRLKYQ